MVVVNARVIFCFKSRVLKIFCVTLGFGVTSQSELYALVIDFPEGGGTLG